MDIVVSPMDTLGAHNDGRTMKRIIWCTALVLASAGCDDKKDSAAEAEKANVPTKAEVADEVATGVKDELSGKGAKWKVEYKGEISGELEGGILTAMSVASNVTAVGKAMAPDKKGSAPQSVSLKVINANTDKPQPMMSLTLADGTKCKPNLENGPPSIKLISADRKTFHAEVEGAMTCNAKKMTYKAVLQK